MMTPRTAGWINRCAWCIVLVFAIGVAWQGVSHATARGDVARLSAPLQSGADENETTPKPPTEDPFAKAVAERNVFAPPKPTGFRGKLTAVLGDMVVFNDTQTGSVGDTVMGAKVIAVGTNWVEIEFEGKTIRQQVFDQNGMPPDMQAALENKK